MRGAAWAVPAVLLAGCGGDAPPLLESVPLGAWGGDHAKLVVDAAGADLELDCAHGRIAEPLLLDAAGRFRAEGGYVAEGGPARDVPRPRVPAVFEGSTDGHRLSLRVRPAGAGSLGPFVVFRGEPERLLKCL